MGQAVKLRPDQMCPPEADFAGNVTKVVTASKVAELDLNGCWARCEAAIDVSWLCKDCFGFQYGNYCSLYDSFYLFGFF